MMPSKRIWIDYDDEADVLYISFYKPQKANDSIMEDNVIYHYRDEKLVGITVIRATLNSEYLESIKEARRDYKEGRIISHEDIF